MTDRRSLSMVIDRSIFLVRMVLSQLDLQFDSHCWSTTWSTCQPHLFPGSPANGCYLLAPPLRMQSAGEQLHCPDAYLSFYLIGSFVFNLNWDSSPAAGRMLLPFYETRKVTSVEFRVTPKKMNEWIKFSLLSKLYVCVNHRVSIRVAISPTAQVIRTFKVNQFEAERVKRDQSHSWEETVRFGPPDSACPFVCKSNFVYAPQKVVVCSLYTVYKELVHLDVVSLRPGTLLTQG